MRRVDRTTATIDWSHRYDHFHLRSKSLRLIVGLEQCLRAMLLIWSDLCWEQWCWSFNRSLRVEHTVVYPRYLDRPRTWIRINGSMPNTILIPFFVYFSPKRNKHWKDKLDVEGMQERTREFFYVKSLTKNRERKLDKRWSVSSESVHVEVYLLWSFLAMYLMRSTTRFE